MRGTAIFFCLKLQNIISNLFSEVADAGEADDETTARLWWKQRQSQGEDEASEQWRQWTAKETNEKNKWKKRRDKTEVTEVIKIFTNRKGSDLRKPNKVRVEGTLSGMSEFCSEMRRRQGGLEDDLRRTYWTLRLPAQLLLDEGRKALKEINARHNQRFMRLHTSQILAGLCTECIMLVADYPALRGERL